MTTLAILIWAKALIQYYDVQTQLIKKRDILRKIEDNLKLADEEIVEYEAKIKNVETFKITLL